MASQQQHGGFCTGSGSTSCCGPRGTASTRAGYTETPEVPLSSRRRLPWPMGNGGGALVSTLPSVTHLLSMMPQGTRKEGVTAIADDVFDGLSALLVACCTTPTSSSAGPAGGGPRCTPTCVGGAAAVELWAVLTPGQKWPVLTHAPKMRYQSPVIR